MICENETYTKIEKGHCSVCGTPHEKIHGSSMTCRTDQIRYAKPDDSEPWCVFRCRGCHEIIEQTFITESSNA